MSFRTNLPWLLTVLLSLHCTFYIHKPGEDSTGGSGNTAGGGNSIPMGNISGDPPAGEWVNATGNLVEVPAGFGNLTLVSASPYENRLFAGVSEGGVWTSTDGGKSWRKAGSGKGSAPIDNRPSSIIYDPKDADSFWLSGTYGDGVFRTHDSGVTFERLGMISRIDLVSVDFADPGRMTLLAGQHESPTFYLSSDGGATWDDISATIGPDVNPCAYPFVIDGKNFLVTCSPFGGGLGGVFRSSDAGMTWSRASESSADQQPLLASDGSIYWSAVLNGGLLKSADAGVTWSSILGDSISIHPIELPDGRIATVNKDYVLVSDGEKKWHPASAKLPIAPAGLAYSPFERAFYIWHLSSDPMPPADAIARFDFDYEKN